MISQMRVSTGNLTVDPESQTGSLRLLQAGNVLDAGISFTKNDRLFILLPKTNETPSSHTAHPHLSTLQDIQREIQAADRRCARLRNTATRLLETKAAKGCAGRSISRLGSPPPLLSPIIHGRHRPYSAVDR